MKYLKLLVTIKKGRVNMRALTQTLYKHILSIAKEKQEMHDNEVKNGTLNKMDTTYNIGFVHGVQYVLDSMKDVDRYIALPINAGNDINGNPCKVYIIVDTVYCMIVNVIDAGYKDRGTLYDETLRLNNLYNGSMDVSTWETIGTVWKSVHVNKREYIDLLKFGENVRNELA
jgi:hypothetical protein